MPDYYGPVVLMTCKKLGIKQQHCNKIKTASQGYLAFIWKIVNKVSLWLSLEIILMTSLNILVTNLAQKAVAVLVQTGESKMGEV